MKIDDDESLAYYIQAVWDNRSKRTGLFMLTDGEPDWAWKYITQQKKFKEKFYFAVHRNPTDDTISQFEIKRKDLPYLVQVFAEKGNEVLPSDFSDITEEILSDLESQPDRH